MKKLLVLFVVAMGATWITASIAVAGNGQGTIQFTAAYPGVGATCKGQRIVTTGPNATVRDRETCEISNQLLFAAGTYEIFPPDGNPATLAWGSDYDGKTAGSGTVVVKNRPDGTQAWQIHATYPVGVSSPVAGGGNLANAKKCQKNGWKGYVRADLKTVFANQGDCVSYAAQGGVLVLIPTLASQPLCEFYGGTFETGGPDLIGDVANPVLWVCNGQIVTPTFDFDGFVSNEFNALAYDCLADGGVSLHFKIDFFYPAPGVVSMTCYGP